MSGPTNEQKAKVILSEIREVLLRHEVGHAHLRIGGLGLVAEWHGPWLRDERMTGEHLYQNTWSVQQTTVECFKIPEPDIDYSKPRAVREVEPC